MTTDCTLQRYLFQGPGRREIVATFDGGRISSDGGLPLVSEVDRRRRIVERFAACFEDSRQPGSVEHSAKPMRFRYLPWSAFEASAHTRLGAMSVSRSESAE